MARLCSETIDCTFGGDFTNEDAILVRRYDDLGRNAGLLWTNSMSLGYTYDAVGRFIAVTVEVGLVTSVYQYAYTPGFDMLASCTSEHSTVNYSYEQNRNLRTVVDNNSATGLVSRFEYTYDAAGRRTERLDSLALTNTFAYNVRSELIEAAMDTNEYKYAYDSIGNREWAQMNAQSNSYVANDLNQYTNIIEGGTPETLFYDADGNLTNANGWTFSWNGENRLIRASDGTTTVSYVYDYMGRRIRKDVVSDTRDDSAIFIYDGWNLIAELGGMASSPSKADYYVWGLDLSGSLQGAGGIGGLLAHIPSGDTNTTASAHLAFCDANGNITDYIAIYPDGSGGTNGTVVARYQYDPYGNLIEQNGPEADTLRFRFSSKYSESELETATSDGLYYYGYRFYSPNLGRWMSRDPIGEEGGLGLYTVFSNNGIDYWDYIGLKPPHWSLGSRKGAFDRTKHAKASAWLKKKIKKGSTGSLDQELLLHFAKGDGRDKVLTEKEKLYILESEVYKKAVQRLDQRLLKMCSKLKMDPGSGKEMVIKFNQGWPGSGSEYHAEKMTFSPGMYTYTGLDYGKGEGGILFRSFHNAYLDGVYRGKCYCIDEGQYAFKGTVEYQFWDLYIFKDRSWDAGLGIPADDEMYQLQYAAPGKSKPEAIPFFTIADQTVVDKEIGEVPVPGKP